MQTHMDRTIAASSTAFQSVLFWSLAVLLMLLSVACTSNHALGSMAPIATLSKHNTDSSDNTVCVILPGSRRLRCLSSNISQGTSIAGGEMAYVGLAGGKGFFCGLREPWGRPFCWAAAENATVLPPRRLSREAYAQIAVGDSHICGIRSDSSSLVDCWRGGRAQLLPPRGIAFSQITAGANFTCGLTVMGSRVVCWGSVASVQPGLPSGSQVWALQAGEQHICGLVGQERIPFCWGDNGAGQIELPPGSRFSSFALGSAHSCALEESSQEAVCWGDDTFGQLQVPRGLSFTSIAAADHYTCGVSETDLSVICWGKGFSAATQSVPLKSLPGICSASPCPAATHPFQGVAAAPVCGSSSQQACVACKVGCPVRFSESAKCESQGNSQCSPSPSPSPSPLPLTTALPSAGDHRHSVVIAALVLGSAGTFLGLVSAICWVSICCFHGYLKKHKIYHSEQTETQVSSFAIAAAARSSKASNRLANAFSFEELEKATDGFSAEKKIGDGSFGDVYSGLLSCGQRVAIKRARNLPNAKKYAENEIAFENELQFLTRLHHKHLVSLVGYCEEEDEMLLVYDYMPNGTLFDHLHMVEGTPSPLRSWQMRMKLALEGAKGIEYLHIYAKPPIIHRDIKSQNILIDATWAARVSDFGLSLMGPMEEESHLSISAAGTFGYMDPQYYSLQQLTPKSDVYSFGVVLLELLTGKRATFKSSYGPENLVEYAVPFILTMELQTILDPKAEDPDPRELSAISLLAEVGEQCVRFEGKERPTMSEVVSRLEQAIAKVGANQKHKARSASSELEMQ